MSSPPSTTATDAQALLARMRQRTQTAPRHLVEPGPDAVQRRQLLDAAASAPDHGRILPWRLVLVERPARARLAEAFEQALLERVEAAEASERERAREKASHGPFLALAVVRDGGDGHEHIPHAERLVSLGCALQNLLLMAHAQGFGAGLVSGPAMQSRALRDCFGLDAREHAVCFVAVGTVARPREPRERPDPAHLITFLDPLPAG